jgi:hypothetical protein
MPGKIAFLGSGETSLAGGRIFEQLARDLPRPLHAAVLETPAGFELNAPQVAGRVADFLRTRLGNYDPQVELVAARKRGTPFSPDDPEILKPLRRADLIFLGPGSPTYAVRQLQGSLAWDMIRARHRLGAAVVFASAATIAAGEWALPVYEIFKAGEDVHTRPGLGLLPLSFIPHWNNAEGGADLDTSRCFVGMERFAEWCAQLPPGRTVVGLDEHTGLILDFATRTCQVSGVSSVSLVRECDPRVYPAGSEFGFDELGEVQIPDSLDEGISPAARQAVLAPPEVDPVTEEVPPEVLDLADRRQQARLQKDWAAADRLRGEIAARGWSVTDTPEGPQLSRP